MTTKEYRAALDKLGMTIVGAAPVLGISRRHSQRIAGGGTPVPAPVEKLLKLMLKHGVKQEDV